MKKKNTRVCTLCESLEITKNITIHKTLLSID